MSGIRGLKLTAVVLVLCTAVVLANENRSDEAAFLAAVRQLDSAASLKRARKRLESLRQSSTDQLVRAEAAFQLGRAHRAARRSDLALQVWEEALSDAQGTVWRAHILVAIGHEHEAAGRTHEALIAYQQVLTENPRGTIALRAAVASGRLFEREDDLANALAAYEWSLNFAASTGLDRDTGIRNQLPAVRRRLTRLQHIVGQERAAAAQQQRTLAIQDRGEDVLLFEEARQAQLSGRTREALARYQQLDQRFPKSEHIAQAAFEAGRCLIALGEFGQAKAHWFTMIRLDPRGAFRGQAQIALGDLALEHDLDLSAARQRYERVISQAAGNVHESWIQASVDAQQRLGVCWMLLDQPEKCRQAFDRVRQAEIQAGFGGSVPLSDVLRTLVAIARDGKIELEDNDDPRADAVAYAELFRTGGTKSRLAIAIADVLFDAMQYGQSAQYYGAVAAGDLPNTTTNQRGYCRLQEGRSRYQLIHDDQFKHNAVRCYKDFLDVYARTPWAPGALVRGAVVSQTNFRNNADAVKWLEHVLRSYPRSKEAERALLYFGWNLYWLKRYDEARSAYQAYLARYPEGKWVRAINRTLLPELDEASRK